MRPPPNAGAASRLASTVQAEFAGSGALVEHVLNIMLEGVRNVRRHAFARSAIIAVRGGRTQLQIAVDDDGVGVTAGTHPPWSILVACRTARGRIRLSGEGGSGAHLAVVLPNVPDLAQKAVPHRDRRRSCALSPGSAAS